MTQVDLFGAPQPSSTKTVSTKGIGGSEVAAVFGLHPLISPRELWMRKTGQGLPQRQNAAMRRGVALEPVVRRLYEEHTGLTLRAGQRLRHQEWGQGVAMIAATDGTLPDGGVFEAKTTRKGSHRDVMFEAGDVPVEYALQLQHYAEVTGQDGVIAALTGPLHPDPWRGSPWHLNVIAWVRIPELGLLLRQEVKIWVTRHILEGEPPDEVHPQAKAVLELLQTAKWRGEHQRTCGDKLVIQKPKAQLGLF